MKRKVIWDKVKLDIEGETVNAIAPVIISASQATDIPAFHGQWLMNRLQAGHVVWINPFSGRKSHISFEKAGAFVFWTKNPRPFFRHMDEFDKLGIDYYFQYTLNDYEDERLEPCLPSLDSRISAFKELSGRIGRNRVIWRFDPIVLGAGVSANSILLKIKHIGDQIAPFTEKMVFSFVDIARYRKVQRTIARTGKQISEPGRDQMLELGRSIANLCRKWGITPATCAEAIDLSPLGIGHNKCIDDKLLMRICGDNNLRLKSFLERYTEKQLSLTGGESVSLPKDKGKQPGCACAVSKDIGMYSTCGHMCVYCYANTSEEIVRRNLARKNNHSETIVPL